MEAKKQYNILLINLLTRKANTTLQEIIFSIGKNNFIDQSNVLIEKYKDFLSSLTVEQLCPLLNTLGLIVISSCLIVISSCLISIVAIIYSDFFIKF